MKSYLFTYPYAGRGMNQCSTYLPAENDDAAIELAFGMLMESHDEGCPDVYGGRISIFGMTIVRDCKIWTRFVAHLDLEHCDCCGGAYVEVDRQC